MVVGPNCRNCPCLSFHLSVLLLLLLSQLPDNILVLARKETGSEAACHVQQVYITHKILVGWVCAKICGCKALPNQSQTHRSKLLHGIFGFHSHAFRKPSWLVRRKQRMKLLEAQIYSFLKVHKPSFPTFIAEARQTITVKTTKRLFIFSLLGFPG